MTELFITEPINILDFEQPLPAVDIVNTGDLRWPTTAEQWGNVMVRVEDAIVTNNELHKRNIKGNPKYAFAFKDIFKLINSGGPKAPAHIITFNLSYQ